MSKVVNQVDADCVRLADLDGPGDGHIVGTSGNQLAQSCYIYRPEEDIKNKVK